MGRVARERGSQTFHCREAKVGNRDNASIAMIVRNGRLLEHLTRGQVRGGGLKYVGRGKG